MKIVTPFRPFAPESGHHQRLGPFDWHGAIEMLRTTARRYCHCDTFVITDVDHTPPGLAHRYVTTERRLMLWILEVSLAYLRSDDFNEDTVMVSPDVLVFGDLRPMFQADLGLLVRTSPKFAAKPMRMVMNSVQWWRADAWAPLVRFYERALDIARQLPDERIRWGADTDPLVELVAPVEAGRRQRAGLSVYGHELGTVMQAFSLRDQKALDEGRRPAPPVMPLFDFKYQRKTSMRAYFNAVVAVAS